MKCAGRFDWSQLRSRYKPTYDEIIAGVARSRYTVVRLSYPIVALTGQAKSASLAW
jgi:hypothetical protein